MRGSCGFRNGSPLLRNLRLRSAVIPSESCTPSNSHSQQQKCKERIAFTLIWKQDSKKLGHPRVHYIHRTDCHGEAWGGKSVMESLLDYRWVYLTEVRFINLLQETAWVFHICLGLPVETGSLYIQMQSLFFFLFFWEGHARPATPGPWSVDASMAPSAYRPRFLQSEQTLSSDP